MKYKFQNLLFKVSHLQGAFLFLCFALSSLSASAQTVHQLTKAGDTKFSEGDFYASALYYKDALKKDEENAALNFKYAEALRMFNDYENASKAYREVTRLDKSNEFPLAYFWLGEMLRSTCDCKTNEAVRELRKFRAKYRKKDYYSAKCQQELEACAWVLDHQTPNDSVKIEHLGKEVNTEQSEFNAIHVFPDKLQFSALRNISADDKKEDYKVRIYNEPPTPQKIFMPNGANPEMHIGNGAYSPDSKDFFFTECESNGKTTSRCDIYLTKYENFKWQPAQKLSSAINNPSATNTQPSVGYDKEGNEVLFFASDRSGGQGGMDIWVSKKNADGTYGEAVNTGDVINTPGNEITPFYDINYHRLFFSSDWHYGFGAYDIFKTEGEYTNWMVPQNLMQPINTPQNDLYYSLALDNSKAYITSNRKGSYFIEAETCCNDIYAYVTNKKVQKSDSITTAKVDTAVAPVTPSTTSIEKTKTFIDEKIKNIKQKLPVRLYFHNDEPDARTMSDTTSLDYKESYEAYVALVSEYEREFAKGLKGEAKQKAEEQIESFFADKVDEGFHDLVAFASQLTDILQTGNKVEVTIKGYCSPLNFNQYNLRLGDRRVASLRNYFFHYRDGMLLPFIASGQLVLKNESFGEETAPSKISDSREDVRNSVYSPAAALERRVEIVDVLVR